MAIEPGTKLFGEVVESRRRHSISSLSDATGLHPRTLNRALVRTGEIPDADENRVDCGVSVDASVGETLAKRIINSIPISQIPTYLNCNQTQAEMLVRHGILHKLVPELGGRCGVLTNVALEDIDNLLARMRSVGQPVSKASPGMMS